MATTKAIAITGVPTGVGWSITKPAWVTLDKVSGTGNDTVTASVSVNSGALRTGNIVATADNATTATVAVTQNATTSYTIAADTATITFDAAGTLVSYT